MNPFTESTVARPLGDGPCARFAGAAGTVRRRTQRSIALLTLGLVAGTYLPGKAQAIDVNVATQEQLRDVRGIGPKTAQTIIEERTRGGRYESIEDLSDRVKGIGPKKAAALKASGLAVGAGPSPSAVFPTAQSQAIDAKGAADASNATGTTAGPRGSLLTRPRQRSR